MLLDRIWRVGIWIAASGLVSSLFSTAAYAYAAVGPSSEFFEIPKDRLPLDLVLNVTSAGLEGNYVSKIQLSLYENNNSEKVMNVTYAVILGDGGFNTLMQDIFYAENGTATLLLVHGTDTDARIDGHREQYLDAWMADPTIGPDIVRFTAPTIHKGGIYEISIEVYTIDDIRKFVDLGEPPEIKYIFDTGEEFSARYAIVPEFLHASIVLIACLSGIVVGRYLGLNRKLQGIESI